MHYAHSRNRHGTRHDLVSHLRAVATMTAQFAAEFGVSKLGYRLGLWHDLGKFSPEFQAYLRDCEVHPSARTRGPDHKAVGVQLAVKYAGLGGLLVQGHHGGLRSGADLKSWLDEQTGKTTVREALKQARLAMPDLEPADLLALPTHVHKDPVAAEFFIRILFSSLVDADYLDTEKHFREDIAIDRGVDVDMQTLWERFAQDQRRFSGRHSGEVNKTRHEIYESCLAAAQLAPGLFRLTVPTGGGKTRSAMAFALRHALKHGQKRVIVAVPFVSITEQTADVYRDIFESENDTRPVVLEHHSGVAAGQIGSDEFRTRDVWMRLAAENWDAPIVVTTTVQLFESLFSNSTSRCRKLHRLAHSVIVLDEAQALPPYLLTPILDSIQQLCAYYGTTVVISTATQPAFEAIPSFTSAPAMEMAPNPLRLYHALHRVDYKWITEKTLSWGEVALIIKDEPQALVVCNTKKDALALLDALAETDALHLSTLLCGAHRRSVIREVKRRLDAGEWCRLVSTQVIEAGVDLDFPLVLRALGPLDGVIQAAGRCNREGKLERGRVIIFRPEDERMPLGTYRTAAGVTGALVGGGDIDPNDPDLSRVYFRRLFEAINTDRDGIQKLRAELNYPEVAHRFRMIDDNTEAVAITTYGSGDEQRKVRDLIQQLSNGAPEARLLLRSLQPYLVSIRSHQADQYTRTGLISSIMDGLGEWHGAYHPVRGLIADHLDPDILVV